MNYPSAEIQQLYDAALRYEQAEDYYSAIKLYKLAARKDRQWAPPVARLGRLYKERQEWKPALHYNKRTVALTPDDQQAWWNLGIAATALGKWRLAKNTWGKFGLDPWKPAPVCIRLAMGDRFEIIWGKQIDPARALIQNIPSPEMDRRYHDLIMLDREIVGYNVVQKRRIPIFSELGLYKRSVYRTYSCWLDTADPSEIAVLENLCNTAHLGFEVWSRAVQLKTFQPQDQKPEYYDPGFFASPEREGVVVAIAAKQDRQVIQVLESWEVICLKSFFGLKGWK